jgi:hypothetical protein
MHRIKKYLHELADDIAEMMEHSPKKREMIHNMCEHFQGVCDMLEAHEEHVGDYTKHDIESGEWVGADTDMSPNPHRRHRR